MNTEPPARPRVIARPILLGLLLAAIVLTNGCLTNDRLAPLYDWVVPTRWPDPEYDEFYPYYVELCAVSQFRPKGGIEGGIPGHGTLYLKGACLDPSHGYPRLRRCEAISTDELEAGHGTGISVNRWFTNVNWIGVPGKHLFYNGNVTPWDVLDQAAAAAAAQAALDLGVYSGVELGEYPTQEGHERSLEDFVRLHSMGTDFALRYGRTIFCSRVPVEAPQVDAMIDFLNEQNRQYAEGEADYKWSGYSDNCVHLVHNALAAAHIWKPLSVRQTKLKQLFNLAVPANEFVDLTDRTLLFEIEDFGKIWRDSAQHKALLEYDWLSTRHGAMSMTMPVHQENELYDTSVRLFVLQRPFSGSATNKANRILGDGRATELYSNLRFFKARYEAILAERKTEENEIFRNLGSYDESRVRYYEYIERQLAEVELHLGTYQERTKQMFEERYQKAVPAGTREVK
ncbi:MAG: hypothetical protein JRH17_09600 [Deltaproteobacteria bacterium]|nr:hypothetical protein [Deltaproteobacteria bacterium]